MTIYIDENGLTIPTQAEMAATSKANLLTKLEGRLRDDPAGPAHRILVNMLNEAKSETLSTLQMVVKALLPGTSFGEFLIELMRFNGITLNESRYSTVSLSLTANAGGMNEPADKLIAATVAGDEYLIIEPVVLTPSATGIFSARSVTQGAFTAGPGEITEIVTPAYGWGSVTNLVDVVPGRATETDPAARRRRWQAARGVGLHHPSAIKRALLDLDGVTDVFVKANGGTTTSPEGIPPGAVMVVVWGGDQQDIVETLFGVGTAQDIVGFGSIAAGIGSYGSTTVLVTDTEAGQSGEINYTIGNDVPIYVQVRTRVDSDVFPSNGFELIKQAIVDFFNGDLTITLDETETIVDKFEPGEDVTAARLYTPANVVDGHTIQEIYIGTTSPPTSSADVPISVIQRAVTSTALISIVSV